MKLIDIFLILGIIYVVSGAHIFNMCKRRRKAKRYITNPGFPGSSITNSSGLV
jgi:hypothetical protein